MIIISSKKNSIITLSIAIFLSCVTIVSSLIFSRTSEKASNVTEVTKNVGYILKDYNGHLAVFYSNESTPYEEFYISTNSFSEFDQDMLKNGIRADTEAEIQKLIEDYTS